MWRAGESIQDFIERRRDEGLADACHFTRVSEWVEAELSRVPDSHIEDVKGRLRAKKWQNGRSAMFELFLHDVLRSSGLDWRWFDAGALEQTGLTSSPDFLVQSGCEKVAVEAKVVSIDDMSYGDCDQLRETLLSIEFNDTGYKFSANYRSFGGSGSLPSKTRLRNEINSMLDKGDGGVLEIDADRMVEIEVSKRKSGEKIFFSNGIDCRREFLFPRIAKTVKKAKSQHDSLQCPVMVAISLPDLGCDVYGQFHTSLYKLKMPKRKPKGQDVISAVDGGVFRNCAEAAEEKVRGIISFGSCYPWDFLCSGQPNLTLWCRPGLNVEDVCPGWVFDSVTCKDAEVGPNEPIRGKHYSEFF